MITRATDRVVVLVRHAAPRIESDVPTSEWNLSSAGVDSCRALAEDLRSLLPAALASSPEPKAMQTAELIASDLDLEFSARNDLEEHRRSRVFLPRTEFDSGIRAFFQHPTKTVLGDESCDELGLRIETEIEMALSHDPSKNAILVTHGTAMTSFIKRHWPVNAHEVWMSLGLPAYLAFTVPAFGIVGASGVDIALLKATASGA